MSIIMTTLVSFIVSASHYTHRDYLFFLLNLGIISGYLSIVAISLFPSKILPIISYFTSPRSRLSIAAFFIIASVTRAELAWNAVKDSQLRVCPDSVVTDNKLICLLDITPSIIYLHVLQMIIVWLMIIFVSLDLLRKFEVVRIDEK